MGNQSSTVSRSPEATFALGEKIGAALHGGEVILLTGGLGAGKTLLTKGILSSLDFDIHEVTSPSFTLVNLYRAPGFDVYHIDLWRAETGLDAVFAVDLHEVLEDESGVVVIEWADRLGSFDLGRPTTSVRISGDGDEPRRIEITYEERSPAASG